MQFYMSFSNGVSCRNLIKNFRKSVRGFFLLCLRFLYHLSSPLPFSFLLSSLCCLDMRFVKLTCPPFCGLLSQKRMRIVKCLLMPHNTHTHTHRHSHTHTLTHTHIISRVVAGQANKLIFHIFFGKTLHELYIKVIMWSRVGCMCVRERETEREDEGYRCVCVCGLLGFSSSSLVKKICKKNVV